MCYCFSKKSDKYFYTMVENENIRNQMFEYIKKYRTSHTFINGLEAQNRQQPKCIPTKQARKKNKA